MSNKIHFNHFPLSLYKNIYNKTLYDIYKYEQCTNA